MKNIKRRKSRIVRIGDVRIGGGYPIAIQSMAKCPTRDTRSVLKQIKMLEDEGCEIVRLAILDEDDARAISKIKSGTSLPIVADIHFNYKHALESIKSGADKIRLNPGNIHRKEEVAMVASAAKERGISIRIGVNSGSIRNSKSKNQRSKSGAAQEMVKSAMDYVKLLEKSRFYDIVISLKSSDVTDTIAAYRAISGLCDYPLHVGVTATGAERKGLIKASIGIGSLLADGIGDTIRVSLTAEPDEEVRIAKDILSALHIRDFGPEIISCPTCGRCGIDVAKISKELKDRLRSTNYEIERSGAKPPRRGRFTKIAIMGCVVNGPGEAKDADIGIAGGKGAGVLFRKGKILKKVKEKDMVEALLKEINPKSKNQNDNPKLKNFKF